jgi:hypothetical protein
VPSGKRAKQQRKAAAPPPPVRSKGGGGGMSLNLSRRALAIGAAVIVLAGLGIGLGVGLSGGGGSGTPSGSPVDFSKLSGLQTGPPPWNNDLANLQGNLAFLDLNALSAEGTVLHIHQHVDVYVNGTHVPVPADIGIFGTQFITEIHTHDTSGIVHVESPQQRTFWLGQFFGEWGVRVSSDCLGRYCGHLQWWVNGQKQTGDPADLVLKSHQEIVIAAGKLPAHVPTSYKFPPGY